MPQRAIDVLLAIAGLVTVAGLVLVGVDLRRAAGTGPRWKRRLISAGLVLLAALGMASCEEEGTARPGDGTEVQSTAGTALENTRQWQRLCAAWKEAGEIASGKRGPYPFNEAGQKRVLKSLEQTASDIDSLRKAGHLSEPEAALLTKELAELAAGVQAKRPTEMRNATCYEPMSLNFQEIESVGRLSQQLPLLEKLAAAETLKPEVVEKVLGRIEEDLARLDDADVIEQLPPAERRSAPKVRDQVKRQVQRIRARLAGDARLENTPEWKTVTDAWRYVVPLAESRKSSRAQRKLVDEKLNAAKAAAATLAAAGLITAVEAQLLVEEADGLRTTIYRDPPTDPQVLCYDMMYVTPAADSLERLAKRVPLLKKLAEEGGLHRGVLDRVLPTVEADLKRLSDEEQLEKLTAEKRVRAVGLRREVRAALDEINGLLGETR